MQKSFTDSFNNLNENKDGFTRADELSRIPVQPAVMDTLAKTAQEAAAAFPEDDTLGNLIVLPVPGWGAPLFATNTVIQQLAQAAAFKEVQADHHFQSVRNNLVNETMTGAMNEAKASGKPFDLKAAQQKTQEAVTQLTNRAMDELMRPDATRKPEEIIMETDPKRVNDAMEHIIREATEAHAVQAAANGTLAFPNTTIDITQTEDPDETGNPDLKKTVIGQLPVQMIALAVSNNYKVSYPATFTAEMSATTAMDRAIGNIIFKGDPDAAEAFAALRHRQRYPHQQTDYAIYRNEALASNVILHGDASRYAADAFDLAMKKADELGDNISAVSLKDLAGMAEDIADQAVPEGTGDKMDKIEEAFEPVTDYYQSYLDKKTTDTEEQARAKIAEMVLAIQLKSDDADIKQVANSFLAPPETQAFMKAAAADVVTDELNAAKPATKAVAPRQ